MKFFVGLICLLLSATVQAQLSLWTWTPPAVNADGTPLTDLQGYNVECDPVVVAQGQTLGDAMAALTPSTFVFNIPDPVPTVSLTSAPFTQPWPVVGQTGIVGSHWRSVDLVGNETPQPSNVTYFYVEPASGVAYPLGWVPGAASNLAVE